MIEKPAKLLAQIHADGTEPISPEATKRIEGAMVRELLKFALIPDWLRRDSSERGAVLRAADVMREQGIDIRFEGVDELESTSLIFANHTGKQGNGIDQGGLETMVLPGVVPNGTRVVHMESLLNGKGSIAATLLARAARKRNPITVREPTTEELEDALNPPEPTLETQTRRKKAKSTDLARLMVYADKIIPEVSTSIFDAIDVGETVALFPEAKRSTGNVLPLLSGYFREAIKRYALSGAIEKCEEPAIGLAVSSTMPVVPEGWRGGQPWYPGPKRKIHIEGFKYNIPDELRRRMIEFGSGHHGDLTQERHLNQLAMAFAQDVRVVMEAKLCDMLKQCL